MTEDDVERALSAPEVHDGAQPAPRGKRQRAADLFSPHRYRALQLSAFERRAGRVPAEDLVERLVDDVVDPLLSSDAPAAEAARAHVQGLERHEQFEMLSPVDAAEESEFPFPYDPSGGEPDDDVADDLGASEEAGEGFAGDMDGVIDEYADADADADAVDADAVDADLAVAETQPSTPEERLAAIAAGGWSSGQEIQGSDLAQDDEAGLVSSDRRSRSGRNMPVATVVGLALLGVTVAAAIIHPFAFAALLYAFAIGAVIEWKRALERHGRRIPVVPVIAATIGLGVATNFAQAEGLVVALLVGCAGVVAWRIGDERIENTLADSLAGVLTLLWIPFLGSFLFLLELADDGWQRVIIVVLAVVGNDTGGLVSGVLFGRRKLLPRVSPAKTWEGAVGGLLLGTVAATVAAYFFFDGEWYIGTAVGAACAIAAVIGDLAESALKRDIQVKDMSTAIPGHGGILDRIDSLLFAAPVGYVVFAIFLGTLGGGGL